MTRKRQRAVRLEEPLEEFLRQEAEKLGITVSELIRRILAQYREGRDT